jgi:hypothetical protein
MGFCCPRHFFGIDTGSQTTLVPFDPLSLTLGLPDAGRLVSGSGSVSFSEMVALAGACRSGDI